VTRELSSLLIGGGIGLTVGVVLYLLLRR